MRAHPLGNDIGRRWGRRKDRSRHRSSHSRYRSRPHWINWTHKGRRFAVLVFQFPFDALTREERISRDDETLFAFSVAAINMDMRNPVLYRLNKILGAICDFRRIERAVDDADRRTEK